MSSLSPANLALLCALTLLAGCDREQRGLRHQPKAETETDVNRPDDPQIHRAKARHFGVVTE